MKHIVFVIGMYKNGGMERRTTTIANQFAKKGYKCTILVTQEMSAERFFDTENDVEIVLLSDYAEECRKNNKARSEEIIQRRINILKKIRSCLAPFKSFEKRVSRKIKMLRGCKELSVYVSNNKESIYVPFGWYHMALLYEAAQKINIKSVYAEKNSPEMEFSGNEDAKQYFYKIISKANGAIMQTEEEVLFYKPYLKNSKVIHNPVKDGLPKPYETERRKVVVNYCRVDKQKNLPLLIEAFEVFHSGHPEYSLEIYGNTITEEEILLLKALENLVCERKLDESIKILPPRADIHEIVKDCAMFVSSSDYEGLSNSMLEAMAIGLPCVCTDCLGGGAREMIKNGENGLLVPMNDVKALALAMERIANDVELAEKCSVNASKIRSELSAEKITEQWIEYIESVI